jgi:hypothetical protein
MTHKRVRSALPIVAVAILLTACGGGGSDAATNVVPLQIPPTVPVQPAIVTGVATPDSLAVVTATNAG